jgi:hypothetical protein
MWSIYERGVGVLCDKSEGHARGDSWGESMHMGAPVNVRTSATMANVTVAVKMIEPEPRMA